MDLSDGQTIEAYPQNPAFQDFLRAWYPKVKMVNNLVDNIVYKAVLEVVTNTVYILVSKTADNNTDAVINRAPYWVMGQVMYGTMHDPDHPALRDFLRSAGGET
jgi:uncharacterized membrane protein